MENKNIIQEVDIVRNLSFPSAIYDLNISPDGKKIIAIGVYKPAVKLYDLNHYSIKFERNLTTKPLRIETITKDADKFTILKSDRTIEFHTKNSIQETVRIPYNGKDMAYGRYNAELLISGNFEGIYRFNLEQGRFMKPITGPKLNKIKLSTIHGLIIGIGESQVTLIDPRSKNTVQKRDFKDEDITCVDYCKGNLSFKIGTENGNIIESDIRKEGFIENIKICDKITNIFNQRNDTFFTTEKSFHVKKDDQIYSMPVLFKINTFAVDNGVVFLAGENETLKTFYVADHGAPAWCKDLDASF